MKSSNILHVFANSSWKGGEQYVFNLSKKLIVDGYTVTFVARKNPVLSKQLNKMGKVVAFLPLKGMFDFYSAIRMAHLFRKNNISVVHVHSFKDAFTAVYARLLVKKSIRIVLTQHLIKQGKSNLLYSWLYKQIDKFIFLSKKARTTFLSDQLPSLENKSAVVYNSLYENEMPASSLPLPLRPMFGWDAAVPIFMFAGRVIAEKGADVLIDACIQLKEEPFYLLMVGDDTSAFASQLKQKVKKAGLQDRIKFYGFSVGVFSLIQECSIGVIPSVSTEIFNFPILEFMKSGKPIIATNNGSQNECITQRKEGLLVHPNDVNQLAKAMHELLHNPTLVQTIGHNAQKKYEKELSYTTFYAKMIAAYFR